MVIVRGVRRKESGEKRQGAGSREQGEIIQSQLTTDNCTGEAFGELFLAMTDNLSSKCFAPTNN
jgi:hypothetical protein